jgi:hypothetical protein
MKKGTIFPPRYPIFLPPSFCLYLGFETDSTEANEVNEGPKGEKI